MADLNKPAAFSKDEQLYQKYNVSLDQLPSVESKSAETVKG
jgi:hypothetical protein